MNIQITKAVSVVREGGVIAYPTEAVFGLGCDPFNESAVQKILHLKHRLIGKGLILIISDWSQIASLVAPLPSKIFAKILNTKEPPTTWVLPITKTKFIPHWIVGDHSSIAIRITEHPIAKALCHTYNGALVSTSANIEGHTPARTSDQVLQYFAHSIDFIIDGAVGDLTQPTLIRDALSDKILRA